MEKPSSAPCIKDILAYSDSISLTQIPCQKPATDYLTRIVESISYDRYTRSQNRLPRILIVGSSRNLLSKGLANDLAFSYEVHDADSLGMHWGYSGTLFADSPEETVYHLRFSDKPPIASFLTEMAFWLEHGYVMSNGTMLRLYNKLFVLSADNIGQVDSSILRHIDHSIESKTSFDCDELALMFRQRCQFMGLKLENDNVALQVANKGRTPTDIFRLLRVIYSIIRADCRANIRPNDVREAMMILNQPVRPQPKHSPKP